MTKTEWLEMWKLEGEEGEQAWQAKQAMHNTRPEAHMVINDIQPYKSMQTGEMIMSRSQHKSHLKQHGLIELGNENIKERTQSYNSEEVKRTIARQLYN